ncbi:Cytosolic sulfotransferase 5 [Morella rubra]|uniref:Sulfotransferase n=1 Tax=Morella rubra TaxID=262757 RepID=A0A6A1UK07_9ROSI|nr:Cytosolic sulfotransferase 5 [Morella rubra]
MAPLQAPPAPNGSKHFKGDELAEERDFISSLPTEGGWLHQYQGFWIPSTFMHGFLSFQRNFQAHDTDILQATAPKVGTTWLKAILFALMNRVCYPDLQQHPLLTKNSHELVPYLDMILYNKETVPDLDHSVSPRLFSTHLSYKLLPTSIKDSTCKIVYLCRDPKDTFVSYWHFLNKKELTMVKNNYSFEEAYDMFTRGSSAYGPYWDHVLSYWKESIEKPQNIFLKFEDLKKHPIAHLRRLAEFLGCPFSLEEEAKGTVDDISRLCSFDNLSNLDVNKNEKSPLLTGIRNAILFRRGEVGDWKNHLTTQMVEIFDRITEEKFHSIGLKF